MRYKPWGEVRYSWTATQVTTPVYTLPKFTFTGQYSYTDDPSTSGVSEGFGLMFYNARMYDPALGRFTSADTMIPQSQGVQVWDRYAYVNNSPVMYTDPSGHIAGCDGVYLGSCTEMGAALNYHVARHSSGWGREDVEESLGLVFVNDWDTNDKYSFSMAATIDARAEYNAYCKPDRMAPGECGYDSAEELYRATHGITTLTMSSTGGDYCIRNANRGEEGTSCFAGMRGKINVILAAHELAHVFNANIGNNKMPTPYNDLATYRANNLDTFPDYNVAIPDGFNWNSARTPNEDFANMFSMYLFNKWDDSPQGRMRQYFMTTNMAEWVGRMLQHP